MTMRSLPLLFFAVAGRISLIAADLGPYNVVWNTTHSYGPDGPWNVVTVGVGSNSNNEPLSYIDLYPGGIWESMINTQAFCGGNDSVSCPAASAGLYDYEHSSTAIQNVSSSVGLIWQWNSQDALNLSGIAKDVVDTMVLSTQFGPFTITNSTISAVDVSQIELPDGTNYSIEVGTLSLGAPGNGLQPFEDLEGQTIPGQLANEDAISSNSFGLHIGSASLKQAGSLTYGGYDQSRVLGEVGAFDLGSGNEMLPSLLDIELGVENGTSPFGADVVSRLLWLNESFNGVQPAVINPIVPYLFMSPQTCAAIAQNLPVTFQPNIGLYTWNTTDPQYRSIVSSPSYLAFVFQNSGAGNLTIKVPFQLLNLTLEPPIVSSPQQYFPCRPFHANEGSGNYFLGRAFLQAAFIGINWGNHKWFMAQAPGPSVGAADTQEIGPNDTSINSDAISNFAATWSKDWTPLSQSSNSSSNNTSSNNASPKSIGTPKSNPSKGLPSNAKAGIGIGVSVGALAIAGFALFVYLRRRKIVAPIQENGRGAESTTDPNAVYEKEETRPVPEFGHDDVFESGGGVTYEADSGEPFHELETNGRL
ncbi:hypothetical protein IMSHALPRED_005056 [Imshaugia aleurites]|uniref:Peptidase A1 domain-containing protein n=1 Tax=Imshaugia aleurites TaxID=172621 RepID=A0A8H3FCC6_9LECA|nr:hypothetical protein IMSHALPRED_005056 [Imshaugia aleurites]